MKILLDTNVVLEFLLKQPHAMEVKQLLEEVPFSDIGLSVFTVDSLGVYLTRRQTPHLFTEFLDDWLIDGNVTQLGLRPEDLHKVVEVARLFNLDFDDAYQVVTAEKYDLILVSFDAHFDSTPRGRKRPADLLSSGRQTS